MIRKTPSNFGTKRINKKEGMIQKEEQYRPFSQFAVLCVDIILKMAEYPKKQELQKKSLVDQICEKIDKFIEENNEQNLISKVERLNGLFRDGIQISETFNQRRITDGRNREEKLLFNPNHIVTGQIIRQLVFQQNLPTQIISYGYHGIAKTFSYYLYHQISNLLISQICISDPKVVKEYLRSKRIINIPKLFFFPMQIPSFYKDISSVSNSKNDPYETVKKNQRQKIKKIFVQQSNLQVSEQYFNNNQLIPIISDICTFYHKMNIKIYLLVDQINSIPSAFREQYNKNPKQNYQKSKEFVAAQFINQERFNIISIKNGFDKIIYNSSVNFEELFQLDNYDQDQNQTYETISQKLKLIREHKQNKNYAFVLPYRIMYPQIIQLDSLSWSLVDTIIFQLKKYKLFTLEQFRLNRPLIYQIVSKNKKFLITFSQIRSIIAELFTMKVLPQKILEITQAIYKEYKSRELSIFTKNLLSFRQKPPLKFYLRVVCIIYNNLLSMKPSLLQNQAVKLFPFLTQSIQCKKNKKQPFPLIERNIFLPINQQKMLKYFLNTLKQFAIKSISNWELNKNQFNKIFQKQFQTIAQFYYSKNHEQSQIIFCLLPKSTIIELLDCQLQKLNQLNKSQQCQVLQLLNESSLGQCLEGCIIRQFIKLKNTKFSTKYIDKNSKQMIFDFSIPHIQKVFEMKQLPRLDENQKEKPKTEENKRSFSLVQEQKQSQNFIQQDINLSYDKKRLNQLNYKNFIEQFFVDKQIQGWYIFKPKKSNSKCIDFALINKRNKSYSIYLFQVTVLRQSNKIFSKKIIPFLKAYNFAIQHIISQAKKYPDIAFDFNYIFIGCDKNHKDIKTAIIKSLNEKTCKQVCQSNEAVQLEKIGKFILRPMKYVNFTQIKNIMECQLIKNISQILNQKQQSSPNETK